jgi:enamine deaminase RidA (YjgF/YER057c/UK114 family)
MANNTGLAFLRTVNRRLQLMNRFKLPGGLVWAGADCNICNRVERLGAEISLDQGYAAGRQTVLNLLAVTHQALGRLARVERVVEVNGNANSAPDFDCQPEVINGASDLLAEILGEAGRHARTSIGVSDLPGHIPVEGEMVVQIRR